jgi:hypothetical protein
VAQRRGKKIADLQWVAVGARPKVADADAAAVTEYCQQGHGDDQGRADRFADPPHQDQRATLIGLGLNKMHRTPSCRTPLKFGA